MIRLGHWAQKVTAVAIVGMTILREPISASRLLGVGLSVAGLLLLRR
jgi:multidrug transporter EmrE-like cation transporter